MIHFCQQIKCDNNGTNTDKAKRNVFFALTVFYRQKPTKSSSQKPNESFTSITCILSVCLEKRVIRNWQQIVSGDLQLRHDPVFEHGVPSPNLWAFIGAATLRALFTAPSTSLQTLFMPTIKRTFLGPCAIADTLFEFPSMLINMPSSVMALQLERKKSASYALPIYLQLYLCR